MVGPAADLPGVALYSTPTSYWASLAASHDVNALPCPAVPDMIEWLQTTGPDGDYNIVLDSVLRMETGLSLANCNFWDRVGYN